MDIWRVRAVGLPDGEDVDAAIGADGTWTTDPLPSAEPLPGRYALPGLVDAHCHLSLAESDHGPVPTDLATARANLERFRAAGVTAIRDTGSPGSISLRLDGDLLACGRFLAPAGRYFPALHEPVAPDDLVEAALAEIAAGATWVKLVGDFPGVGAPGEDWTPAEPSYPIDVVSRLVEAVHAAGARVAAHTTTPYASLLIAAGIDSVEHGTALSEDDLVALAARGGAWTPTLCAVVGQRRSEDPERERRRQETRERLGHLLTRAAELGVTVLTGTDVVGSVPGEVALLSELGLTPLAALSAASVAARRYLGFPPLAHGQRADLVTYDADPREDPEVLARPSAVVLRGVRIR